MRLITAIFFVIAAVPGAPAQQIGVYGPVEGFTFDQPTRTLRAIIGVPGAATFGPAILDRVDFGSVAPHQNYGLAFQSGNCLLVSGLDSTAVSTPLTSGAPGQPEGVAWSADGSLAILYSRSGNWAQTISGFPQTPISGFALNLSSLPGSLSAITSDSHGKTIAVAVSGSSGGVYLTSDGQSFAPVLQSPKVVALSFSSDGSALYALDNTARQLSAVNVGTFSSQNLPLAGLADPLAIQAGEDGQGEAVVYVASGSDQLLRVIEVSSQQVSSDVPLNVAPSGLAVFGATSFIVAPRSQISQPLWLFSSSPQPAAFFVPAIGFQPQRERKLITRGLN